MRLYCLNSSLNPSTILSYYVHFILQDMSYSDQQLRDAVDAVFAQFDADKSGFLDQNEVANLINAALKHMNTGKQVSQQEVNQFVKAVDSSGDGKIQKPELFEIFKKVLSSQKWVIAPHKHLSKKLNVNLAISKILLKKTQEKP